MIILKILKNVKETYEFNLKHNIDINCITNVDKTNIPHGDVILAGIHCQPFSNAGNRKSTKDKDGNLFLEVIDLIKKQSNPPKVVIFENVRGFLSSRDNSDVLLTERFSQEMDDIGYATKFKLLNAAEKINCQLKYVAEFVDGKANVGLQHIPSDHPFYNLEGSDNIVLFFTDRYPENPLIIKGAGAGADVTASGIFADVIRIANQ